MDIIDSLNPSIFYLLSAWALFWKGLVLWKSSQRKQKYWFIAVLLINSIGVLEIIYLIIHYLKEKKSKKDVNVNNKIANNIFSFLKGNKDKSDKKKITKIQKVKK